MVSLEGGNGERKREKKQKKEPCLLLLLLFFFLFFCFFCLFFLFCFFFVLFFDNSSSASCEVTGTDNTSQLFQTCRQISLVLTRHNSFRGVVWDHWYWQHATTLSDVRCEIIGTDNTSYDNTTNTWYLALVYRSSAWCLNVLAYTSSSWCLNVLVYRSSTCLNMQAYRSPAWCMSFYGLEISAMTFSITKMTSSTGLHITNTS